MEDEVVGQILGVAPDDPAHPKRGEPELVARGAEDLTRGTRKSHSMCGRRRGEEGTTRAVDMDPHVDARVLFQLVERLRQLEHRLVGARVGHPEGRHDQDGVLVDALEHVLGRHAVVPSDIGTSRISMSQYLANLCQTTCTARRPCWAGRSACLRPLASGASATSPPCRRACRPPMSRWPSSRPSWRRPGRARDRRACAHNAARARQCGVLVLVDQVLVDRQRHELEGLGFLPRLAEGARFWRSMPSSAISSDTTW